MNELESEDTYERNQKMRLSYSTVEQHRRCARQYAYRTTAGLESDRLSMPASIGTWWHAVRSAESIMRGRSLGSLLAEPPSIPTPQGNLKIQGNPATDLVEEVLTLATRWEINLDDLAREDLESRINGSKDAPEQTLRDYLANLNERYLDRWGAEIENERPMLIEFEWSREVPQAAEPTLLQGRADEIYFDVRRNLIVLRDWKWHGSWPSTSETVSEILDGQVHLYSWGVAPTLARLIEEAGSPYSVSTIGAVEHCRVRGKVPATPKLTKAGALAKSTTDYDAWTYLRWAESGPEYDGSGKKPGGVYKFDQQVYDDLTKDTDAFFRRALKPTNRNLVLNHLKAALEEVPRMRRTQRLALEGREIVPSPGSSCEWCDWKKLCLAEMTGGPVDPEDFDPSDYGLRVRP